MSFSPTAMKFEYLHVHICGSIKKGYLKVSLSLKEVSKVQALFGHGQIISIIVSQVKGLTTPTVSL